MSAQRIRLRDLRYYVLTGAIFGALNSLFAFGPELIKSFGYDGLTQLWYAGPWVPYWLPKLFYFPLGVALFALIGALAALLGGYVHLWRFRRRLRPRRAKQGRLRPRPAFGWRSYEPLALALAEPPDPRPPEAPPRTAPTTLIAFPSAGRACAALSALP